METFFRWLIGLIFSLVIGGCLTGLFVRKLRKYLTGKLEPSDQKEASAILQDPRGIPPWLTSLVEQLFFIIVIAFDVSGAAIAMIGWATVKMYTGWNYPSDPRRDSPVFRLFALSALLGNVVSLGFALVGGLICGGKIWWWP